MRTFLAFVLAILVVHVSLQCGKKQKGPTQQGKSNQQLVEERFAVYKDGFQNKNIDTIMPVISSTYYDLYNHSKEDYLNWLQGLFTKWEWKKPVEMDIVGDIDVQLGWGWIHEGRVLNSTANHREETQMWAVNHSQNLLMSSKADLTFNWEFIDEVWYITRVYGTVGRIVTQPSTLSPGSEVAVSVFTLPEGAPLTAYDTESVTLHDWDGNPISVQDQGNRLYSATFTAPASAGEYTLTATVSDTTWNKTISLEHRFTVQ